MDKQIVAKDVTIRVGNQMVKIDIAVNKEGNLELLGLGGLGPIYYSMLEEELEFSFHQID